MKLFISYSSDDKSYVYELRRGLADDDGQHDVWIDKRLYGGQSWWDEILKQVEECECFIAILTPRSLDSVFCNTELDYALALNKPILPLILKPITRPEKLKHIQCTDISSTPSLEKVLRRCEKELGEIRIQILNHRYDPPVTPIPKPHDPRPIGSLPNLPKDIDIGFALSSLSENTQRSYLRWIRTYLSIADPDLKTSNIDKVDLAGLIATLQTDKFQSWLLSLASKGLGSQSITQAKAAIVWMADLLVDRGFLDIRVRLALSMVRTPAVSPKPIRDAQYLSEEQIQHLIESVTEVDRDNEASASRNCVAILLIVTCGLTREEVVQVNWSDVSYEQGTAHLFVHGRDGKERTLVLPQVVVIALEQWRKYHIDPHGNTPVFTRIWKGGALTKERINAKSLWNLINEGAERAGLPPISPDDLRRSFARNAYNSEVPIELIQLALGHTDIMSTIRFINPQTDNVKTSMDAWADKLYDSSQFYLRQPKLFD